MTSIFLVVGLGNPGKEYEGTRHSIGRKIVEAISGGAEWREKKSLHAEVVECEIADHRVTLAKPTTYMNESGKAAAALTQSLKLAVPTTSCRDPDRSVGTVGLQLVVIHDDLDLPVGSLRLSVGGSSGGQKGVQSIIDALGTEDFIRLRIGIGPNETPDGHRIPAEKFVLERFRSAECTKIDAAIARAVETIEILLRDGLPIAQQFANG